MKKLILMALILGSFGITRNTWAENACFEIQGMTCATCPITVKAAIKKLKGINDVKASLADKNAIVDFDSKTTNAAEIRKAIDAIGYKAIPQECNKHKG